MAPAVDAAAVTPETVFLAASLTKPVTAAAVMQLVERGLLTLDTPVDAWIPEFGGGRRGRVLVRHILSHTSGLPDMVPGNRRLREAHAPLSEFLNVIYDVAPAFEPGTQVSYQSAGFALAGELVRRITGRPLPDFLLTELVEPLGMTRTSLGVTEEQASLRAEVELPNEQRGTDWHWNTPYWLELGAPWGGLLTTVRDYARFLEVFRGGGSWPEPSPLSPPAVRAMLSVHSPQNGPNPVAETWGLGWRLSRDPQGARVFGDLCSAAAFGHYGATGTVAWADTERGLTAVLLTTQPAAYRRRYLARWSNAVAAAVLE